MDCHFAQDRTATGISMGGRQASRSTARTVTARSINTPTAHTAVPRRPGRERSEPHPQPGRAPAFRVAGGACTSVPRSIRPRMALSLVKDTLDPAHPITPRKPPVPRGHQGTSMAGAGCETRGPRHKNEDMTCFTCHSSGPRAAAAVTCRSRPTGRPGACISTHDEARNYATYNRRSPATKCISSVNMVRSRAAHRAGALLLGARAFPRVMPTASSFNPAAAGRGQRFQRRRSRPTSRTPSARPRPRPAPIAISRRTTTTTPSWRSCSCSVPTS